MITDTGSAFSDKPIAWQSRADVVDFRSHLQRINLPSRVVLFEQENEWQALVMQRLGELVDRLPHGWDGYEGRPVSFSNANFALSMLSSICQPNTPVPQVVPGPAGDLQIEWHTETTDIELDVRGPYDVWAWRSLLDGDPEGESMPLTRDFTVVAQWVATISEPPGVANAAVA